MDIVRNAFNYLHGPQRLFISSAVTLIRPVAEREGGSDILVKLVCRTLECVVDISTSRTGIREQIKR
jgi:hypothetical protein